MSLAEAKIRGYVIASDIPEILASVRRLGGEGKPIHPPSLTDGWVTEDIANLLKAFHREGEKVSQKDWNTSVVPV